MKLLTTSLASILFTTVSFAQIPITSSLPTPPTPPQPALINCSVAAQSALYNTTWAFMNSGPVSSGTSNIAQVGTFTIQPGGFITGRRTTNYQGTILERLGDFYGKIEFSCLDGTGVLAAGTLQLAGGLGGSILTWSFPITASPVPGGYAYNVTSVNTMNLRQYAALDPGTSPPGNDPTNGYGVYSNGYVTTGTASRINNQLPCPTPADAALDIFAPKGYAAGLGTFLKFTSTPVNRRGGGSVQGSIIKTGANFNPTTPPINPKTDPGLYPIVETGAYQVYGGCTGFSMNIPWIKNGVMVGGAFEGVFATGDFSRFYILSTNTIDTPFNFLKIP